MLRPAQRDRCVVAADIARPTGGTVIYHGEGVDGLTPAKWRAFDLGVQMVFQNPFASLNPRIRVGEAARVHGIVARAELRDHVAELMRKIGLDPIYANRFPHQFSGASASASSSLARSLCGPTYWCATKR